jgi:hypothetical protein
MHSPWGHALNLTKKHPSSYRSGIQVRAFPTVNVLAVVAAVILVLGCASKPY